MKKKKITHIDVVKDLTHLKRKRKCEHLHFDSPKNHIFLSTPQIAIIHRLTRTKSPRHGPKLQIDHDQNTKLAI